MLYYLAALINVNMIYDGNKDSHMRKSLLEGIAIWSEGERERGERLREDGESEGVRAR